MKKLRLNPIARALLVFGSVAALVTGVTFAALNDSVALGPSTLTTGTADLQIWNFGTNQWAESAPGFTITDLVPGTGTDEFFYLKNNGGVDLNVTANIPDLPAAPTGGYGFTGFENLTIDITGEGCGNTIHTNMQLLHDTNVALPCNPLAVGESGDSNNHSNHGNYKVHFDINPDAISGSQAGVGDFNINFTGTQNIAPTPTPTPL